MSISGERGPIQPMRNPLVAARIALEGLKKQLRASGGSPLDREDLEDRVIALDKAFGKAGLDASKATFKGRNIKWNHSDNAGIIKKLEALLHKAEQASGAVFRNPLNIHRKKTGAFSKGGVQETLNPLNIRGKKSPPV